MHSTELRDGQHAVVKMVTLFAYAGAHSEVRQPIKSKGSGPDPPTPFIPSLLYGQ
jgi:hypothetical protein